MKSNRLFLIASLILAATILAACSGLGANLNPQQGPTPVPSSTTPGVRSITVNGSGKVFMAPDLANINIGVHTEGEDAGTAMDENTAQVNRVIEALRAQGVAANDIQTTSFNIYPSQQYGPNNEVVSVRYMVDNLVYVTVRDLSTLGNLLEAVVSSGANSINGITFDAADKSASQTAARKQAVDNARSLAEELASAAGVELGEIQSINIYTNNGVFPLYDMGRGGGMGAAAAEVPIQTGQLSITADVTMVFEIR